MISRTIQKIVFTAITVMMAAFTVASQPDSLRQEVEVIKSYTPTSIDAEKINEMPVIKDEENKKPDFTYSISGKPVFGTLSVKNLQAATIIGKPAEKPGYGLVRAGVGNYNKPYGELFFNNNNNKNSIFGLHAKHLSSHGKLNLEGGDRVKAPFSDNEAEMFIKHMFRKSTLSLNLGIDHDGFRYYGYPGSDTIPGFLLFEDQNATFQGQRQTFTRGGININLKNVDASKSDPSTGFDFSYYRFGTKTGQRENFATFTANFKRPLETITMFVDAGVEYSNISDVYFDTITPMVERNQVWLFFKPAVYFGNETINLKLGANTWLVSDNRDAESFRITPNIRFNFAPVKEIINMFAGIDGNYSHNYYSSVAYLNPYISPELSVKNHFEKFRFYGGFDGRLSGNTNFKLQVDHSVFDNHPLFYQMGFILPTMGPLPGPNFIDNTFRVMYDDLKITKFNGEVTYHMGEKVNMLVSVDVFKYATDQQTEAWNLPAFNAEFSLTYAVNERLTVAADFYLTGKRESLVFKLHSAYDPSITWEETSPISAAIGETYTLGTIFDLNARANYAITRKFSLFGQLNNFGFQQYERWLGYPVQSFNLLGGISYSF
jgi:hypothetical protein